jgi:hypothetical protein
MAEGEPKEAGAKRNVLRSIATRLPYAKLTAAQTHNVVSDLIGAVLCTTFLVKSDDLRLSLVCVGVVLTLSYLCMTTTDRRRRF